MALFFNEVWLRDPNPKNLKAFIDAFASLGGQEEDLGLTPDVFRLVAGPWMSIEEAKVLFIFDSPDVTATLPAFGKLMAQGLLSKRRLTPLVNWQEAAHFVENL